MLWSLIKIVIFVALVAAAAFGGSYLLEMGGGLVITIPGIQEYNLSPLMAVIGLVLLVLAVWLLLKLVSLRF